MADFTDDRISRDEFINPDHLGQGIVDRALAIRKELNRPMYFSKLGSSIIHPNGDAVPPYHSSHSEFSLHAFGINHSKSKKEGRVQLDGRYGGMAIDFDIETEDVYDLLDIYLQISAMGVGGIGVYPDWNRPGFHLDCRYPDHPNFRARWWCYNVHIAGETKAEYRNFDSIEIKEMFLRYKGLDWKTKKDAHQMRREEIDKMEGRNA